MKKILFVFALSFALFSLAASSNGEEQRTYISPYFNFTINYPPSWQIKEISGMVFFLSPGEGRSDDFSENVGVIIEDLSKQPMSLNEYEKLSLTSAPKLIKDFKLAAKNSAKIDGEDAYSMIYSGIDKSRRLKYKSYTFITGSKAYTLTYTAEEKNYDKYLNQAELVMKSIKIAH
jgi:eukaryotic-like serine/threonine-protein kinase